MTLLFTSCSPNERSEKVIGKKFEDFNYFKMEGVGEIEGVSHFPYFEVSTDPNKISVSSHQSKTVFETEQFFPIESYWKSSFTYSGDTSKSTSIKFVNKDSVITFEYSSDDSGLISLFYFSILTLKREASYKLAQPLSFEPAWDIRQLLNQEFSTVRLREFSRKGDTLRVLEKYRDLDLGSKESVISFQIGKRSIFWWKQFIDKDW